MKPIHRNKKDWSPIRPWALQAWTPRDRHGWKAWCLRGDAIPPQWSALAYEWSKHFCLKTPHGRAAWPQAVKTGIKDAQTEANIKFNDETQPKAPWHHWKGTARYQRKDKGCAITKTSEFSFCLESEQPTKISLHTTHEQQVACGHESLHGSCFLGMYSSPCSTRGCAKSQRH